MLQKPMSEAKISTRLEILAEVGAFVGLAVVSKIVINQFNQNFSGPISLVFTLSILTLYLRSRGLYWSDMGLHPLSGIRAKLMVIPQAFLVFLSFAAVLAPILLIGPAIGLTFLTEVPVGVEDRWGSVRGSWPMYLLWLGTVWTAAAFGEEMFFRGYLVTRLQTAFADIKFGVLLAVVVPALLFGLGHVYYQGLRGLVVTGGIGLAFGTMFLLFKRNLWPLVLWHGIVDTLTFTAIFMNLD
ncbi:MAG: membrane protease YdiL (CAAX protease family) [Myxococcota bacterium]|jgi:membrane protease YdiL (CAAX protease family)